MRNSLAYALDVCLIAASLTAPSIGTAWAGDWQTVHHEGREAYGRGDYAEAAVLFAKSWPLTASPGEKGISANDTAAALHNMGRDKEAQPWFQRALEIWRMLPGHGDDMAETALGLADADTGLGEMAAAEQTLQQALESPGITTDHKAALQNLLGDLLRQEDRLEPARSLFSASLALDGVSRLQKIEGLLGIADVNRRSGHWKISADEWNQAADLARAEGIASLEALAQRGLALTWSDAGHPAQAEPLLRRSLAAFERDANARQIAAGSSSLASVYRRMGKLSLAEQAWLRALEIDRREFGEEHPQVATILESLSELYSAQRRFDEAREYASHALNIMRRLDPQSPPVAGALSILALSKQREMQLEAAAADYALALAILRASGSMGDQIAIEIMDRYSVVLATLHRTREAKQMQAEIRSFRAQ
jgi:tetratricopeptide (TPR) repeat protein